MRGHRQRGCERARRIAALAPDGELSPFEARALDVHMRCCEDCRAFAADVDSITALVREAPLYEMPTAFQAHATPPRPHPLRHAVRRRGMLVAGAAATIGVALGMASGGVIDRRAPALSSVPEGLVVIVDSSSADDLFLEALRRERRGFVPTSTETRHPGAIL